MRKRRQRNKQIAVFDNIGPWRNWRSSVYYKKLKRSDGSTVDEHRIIANVEKAGFNTVVHHIDGDIKNNHPSNLEVMSRSEHCVLHGFGTVITGNNVFAPDIDGKAVCIICGKRKPFEDFCTDNTATNGKKSRCKECFNRIRRERRKQSHSPSVLSAQKAGQTNKEADR